MIDSHLQIANPARGEVAAIVDGRPAALKLTLGSLAALEAALDPPDLMALIERFEAGRQSARDVAGVIAAGLAGGGVQIDSGEPGDAIQGGLPAAYRLAAALLEAAFADDSNQERAVGELSDS